MNLLDRIADILNDKRLPGTSVKQIEQGAGLSRKEMTPEQRSAQRARKKGKKTKERTAEEPSEIRKAAVGTLVVAPMTQVIDQLATIQVRKTARHLGDTNANIQAETWDGVWDAAARSGWETPVLAAAADLIYREHLTDVRARDFDDPAVGKAVKYLLGMTVNQAKRAIDRAYKTDPTLASIEKLDTILHWSASDAYDPLTEKHRANGIHQLGWRFRRPGSVDSDALKAAISEAIRRLGLDDASDVILQDGFSWDDHALAVWKAFGLPMDLIRRQNGTNRVLWAQKAARNRFGWLPRLTAEAYARFSPEYWDTPRVQQVTFRSIVEQAHLTQAVELDRQAREVVRLLERTMT